MDRNQAASAVAETLGESHDRAEQVLTDLFREHAEQNPGDWDDVKQILESGSIDGLGNDQVEPLHGTLQELAGQNGNPGHPGGLFDDPELQASYAPGAPDASQDTGVPVADGSAIHQIGDEFYLYPGQPHQVQLWKAQADDGSAYYYDDAAASYGEMGEPLGDAGSQAQQEDPDAWNSYLAANGSRWDGTEDSWQAFRDWFLYDAAQNKVGDSAHGFITYAESGDKREIFTSYGITLPDAGTAGTGYDHNQVLLQMHNQVMLPVLEQFKAAHPEQAASLGEELLRELAAEATAGTHPHFSAQMPVSKHDLLRAGQASNQ